MPAVISRQFFSGFLHLQYCADVGRIHSVLFQVEVGLIGSEQHSQRERKLRSAIQLQAQLKQSQQKMEALTQQLASTLSEAQHAQTSANAPELHPYIASEAAQAKPGAAEGTQQSSALMESLFGSDDDEDDGIGTDATTSHTPVKARSGMQQGASAAGAAQQRRQTTATAQARGTPGTSGPQSDADLGSLPSAAAVIGQGNPSTRAQHSNRPSPSPSQQLLDPAAPRRSISFSNSLRRRQGAAVQHRRDAFNEAADAALIQTLAQRRAAGAQAADSATEQSREPAAAKPEADESSHLSQRSTPYDPSLGPLAGSDLSQPFVEEETGTPVTPSKPAQASSAMPLALPQQPSGTQGLPGGRVNSAAAPAPASSSPTVAEGPTPKQPPEAPRVITRTSQPEPAPKLKTGSRLAASMAKLAASKRAPNAEPPPVAAATQVKQSTAERKSTLSEDVKRALLAKVCQPSSSVFVLFTIPLVTLTSTFIFIKTPMLNMYQALTI